MVVRRLDFSSLPAMAQDLLGHIGSEADVAEKRIFLVGGAVRDLLLMSPVADIDIVIEGDAIAFANRLAKKQQVSIRPHEKFGTVALTFKDGLSLDMATARSESYARPGALPDIVPGVIKDDLFRRDFTINALACGLNTVNHGVIRDDMEGLADIEAHLIRIIHPKSFQDDPTRILRAARFAARFGFQLDALTEEVAYQAIAAGALLSITPGRYFLELGRILQEKDPVPAMDLLSFWGGIRYLPYEAEDRERLTRCSGDLEDRLAALLGGFSSKKSEEILTSFNLSRTMKREVLRKLSLGKKR
ncbi:MAG: hypothetical protein WCI27_02455 [Candidatus Omnitrophota bacterium]